jgi:3-methyladenine DNA glycosylase Tag
MTPFKDLLALAVNRKGSLKAVQAQLPTVADSDTLRHRDDAFYMSALTRRIFRAGLKHSLVDNKWPAFEKAFFRL